MTLIFAVDLSQGPKFRIGTIGLSSVELRTGDVITLDQINEPGNAERVYFPHPNVVAVLKPGVQLLVDDGNVELKVIEVRGAEQVVCSVVVGGPLSSRKGVNVPGIELPVSAMTPKDREDLVFALSLGCDWVALSFVQRPADVYEARQMIGRK